MMKWRGRGEEVGGVGGRIMLLICINVFQACLQCTLILNSRGPVIISEPEFETEIEMCLKVRIGIESLLPVSYMQALFSCRHSCKKRFSDDN